MIRSSTTAWRAAATTGVLLVVFAVTAWLSIGGLVGELPLGYVNDDFTSPLLALLALQWLSVAVSLALLVLSVRTRGPDRLVSLVATRVVGTALVILVVVWSAFIGWLAAISAGPLLGIFIPLAATGPALALAIGTYAQGRIRSPLLALIPSVVIFVISVAATWIAISTGTGP